MGRFDQIREADPAGAGFAELSLQRLADEGFNLLAIKLLKSGKHEHHSDKRCHNPSGIGEGSVINPPISCRKYRINLANMDDYPVSATGGHSLPRLLESREERGVRMDIVKEASMITTTEPAAKVADEPGQRSDTTTEAKIHWAGTPTQTSKEE